MLLISKMTAKFVLQDLVQLVNADQPLWLQGIVEMTRTFGLELLETLLSSYSPVFYKFQPFQALLKERVCSLVIKLFSPNIKVLILLLLKSNTIWHSTALAVGVQLQDNLQQLLTSPTTQSP